MVNADSQAAPARRRSRSEVEAAVRDAMLRLLEEGIPFKDLTVDELARAAGLSLAAASQHTTVLRGTGLICTQRMGRARLHALTALGADLLATRSDFRP